MKLNDEGKNRLEAMKKALAAGLPLAGLLAGTLQALSATEAAAAPGGMLGAPIPWAEVRRVKPPVESPVKPPAEASASADDAAVEDDSCPPHSPDALPSPEKRRLRRPPSSLP